MNYRTHPLANKKNMHKNAFSQISNLTFANFQKKYTRIFAGSDSWSN